MIVECKAPTLALSASTLHQASAYNKSLQGKYLTITNGLVHYCAGTDWKSGTADVLNDLPDFL
jgi:hypothetical protein